MKSKDIFLETLEDLRIRCHLDASEYDMVQAAGLIRRLVIDGTPLITMANRDARLPITFAWSVSRVAHLTASGGGAWVPGLWLDPVLQDLYLRTTKVPPGTQTSQSGGIKELLAHKAIKGPNDSAVTLKELVKHYANREGGVHFDDGPADNPLLEDIRSASDECLRHSVLALGRIICRALEPLAAATLLKDLPWPVGLKNP